LALSGEQQATSSPAGPGMPGQGRTSPVGRAVSLLAGCGVASRLPGERITHHQEKT